MNDKLNDWTARLGIPRLIIICFVLLLFAVGYMTGFWAVGSHIHVRVGMNGILVLAMVPTHQCWGRSHFWSSRWDTLWAGRSFAKYAVADQVCRLLGRYCLQPSLSNLSGMGLACFSIRSGQEMMVGTYVGFSSVACMCIFWLLAPFDKPELIWAIGDAVHDSLTLDNHFGKY